MMRGVSTIILLLGVQACLGFEFGLPKNLKPESKPAGEKTNFRAPQRRKQQGGDPLVTSLQQKLRELRERKANIVQLQNTMSTTENLIKEGVEMRDVAGSRRAQETYDRQIRDSEAIHKETATMLITSREEAKEEATRLLKQMARLRAMEADIVKEASGLAEGGKQASPTEVDQDQQGDNTDAELSLSLAQKAKKADPKLAATSSKDDDDDDDDDDDSSD